MDICRIQGDEFSQCRSLPGLTVVDDHPFTGGFGRSYYPLVFGTERQNESFFVRDDGESILLVLCSRGDSRLDHYGQPIRIFAAPLSSEKLTAALYTAFDHLRRLAGADAEISLYEPQSRTAASSMAALCRDNGLTPHVYVSGLCDLSLSELELRAALRKSFKSLVNWGQSHLRFDYVNRANPNRESLARYRDFHARIAGRSTRPQSTWDAMFDWIVAGHGELTLAYFDDGTLVAGTMVVDGRTTAYYASGVYDRDRFDKPLAHWPVFEAILRSRARGLQCFDLGDIPREGTVSPKEYNIGYFKRGFATTLSEYVVWQGRLGTRA